MRMIYLIFGLMLAAGASYADYRGMSFATPDQNLGIWQRVNGTWTQLPGTNDTAARRICAPTPTPIAPANPATFGLFTPAVAANELEKLVRAYPEQYLWLHRRWKTPPPPELQTPRPV